jgi:hypothetical protein
MIGNMAQAFLAIQILGTYTEPEIVLPADKTHTLYLIMLFVRHQYMPMARRNNLVFMIVPYFSINYSKCS